MKILFCIWAIFLCFVITPISAQLECLPLHGNVKQSFKNKGKIGYDGRLYIPTNKGLIAYDGMKTEVLNIGTKAQELTHNAVRQIYFSKDSVVWISYYDGGYSKISQDTIQHFNNSGGPSDFLCFDIKEYKGILYMGTKNGIYPYEDNEFGAPININTISIDEHGQKNTSSDIRNIFVSKEDPNKLWLIGLGLFSYDLKSKELTFHKIPTKFLEDFGNLQMFNNAYLFADLLETEEALYLTSWGGGLFEVSKKDFSWKKHLFVPYADAVPLNENVLFEMIKYDDHSILMGSRKGLMQFDTKEKTFAPFTKYGNEEIFTQRDIRLSQISNQVIVCTFRNICLFNLGEKERGKDTLIISDIKLDGISQNNNNFFFKRFQSNFKNYQRNITFEYDYIAPFNANKRSYEYQLKGVSSKWISQNEGRSVNFSNLSGGSYSFQARTKLEDNTYVYSVPFDFKISKYYYENWWFWFVSISSLMLVFGTFLYLKWNQKKKELILLDKHSRELAQLEMSALRAQMNPHFLFNSLNSIKNFALTKGPKETAAYLTKFSHLIRLILQNSKNPMVNLKDELDALKLYIEIESLRFENKFKFKFNIDEGLLITSIQIPPLILQPYVENSIWHGLMHKKDGEGILIISVKDQGDSIQCMIEDNGIGRDMAKKIKKEKIYSKQKSLGMDITNNRIELTNKIYNINTEVHIIDLFDKNGVASGTRVLIKIPKKEAMYR